MKTETTLADGPPLHAAGLRPPGDDYRRREVTYCGCCTNGSICAPTVYCRVTRTGSDPVAPRMSPTIGVRAHDTVEGYALEAMSRPQTSAGCSPSGRRRRGSPCRECRSARPAWSRATGASPTLRYCSVGMAGTRRSPSTSAASAAPDSVAEAARKHDDTGDDDDKPQSRRDDQQGRVEILVAAPVHDVEPPEEIVDAPKRRAARRHQAAVRRDVKRAGRLVVESTGRPGSPRDPCWPRRRSARPGPPAHRLHGRPRRSAPRRSSGSARASARWRGRRAAAGLRSGRSARPAGRAASAAPLSLPAPRPPRQAAAARPTPDRARPIRSGAAIHVLRTRSSGRREEQPLRTRKMDRHQQRQPWWIFAQIPMSSWLPRPPLDAAR